MDTKTKHNLFLYPVVRVFSQSSAGSGTIIGSFPDSKNEDEYITLILTNHHVIKDCLSRKREWNSMVGKDIEKEVRERPKIENFSYIKLSTVNSTNRYDADIIAHEERHDLAILKVDSPLKFENTAKLIPEENIKDVKLFTEIVVSGCSMAHEPFCNYGQITFLKEMLEQKKYLMVNAGSYFGNSGGALFLKETGELIGVPSRITAQSLGFGVDIVTWMGFSAHPERLYEFLREQELNFIFDPKDNYHAAMKRRKNKEKEALLELKAEVIKSGVGMNKNYNE